MCGGDNVKDLPLINAILTELNDFQKNTKNKKRGHNLQLIEYKKNKLWTQKKHTTNNNIMSHSIKIHKKPTKVNISQQTQHK